MKLVNLLPIYRNHIADYFLFPWTIKFMQLSTCEILLSSILKEALYSEQPTKFRARTSPRITGTTIVSCDQRKPKLVLVAINIVCCICICICMFAYYMGVDHWCLGCFFAGGSGALVKIDEFWYVPGYFSPKPGGLCQEVKTCVYIYLVSIFQADNKTNHIPKSAMKLYLVAPNQCFPP